MAKAHILFVCSGPGVRGCIAEAYARRYKNIEAYSACFESKEGTISPAIINLMEEEDILLSNRFPESVFKRYSAGERYDFVITLCDSDTSFTCPSFRSSVGTLYARKKAECLSWTIPDFRSLPPGDAWYEGAKEIRDQIRQCVAHLAEEVIPISI